MKDKKRKKLIIYELNEVPIRVLKEFILNNPKSSFSNLVKNGIIKKTTTFDEGELHPWSTWPTVHRGVNNNIHQIKFINQSSSEGKQYYRMSPKEKKATLEKLEGLKKLI